MPNFASRNHSGIWNCFNDSHAGSNFPFATGSAAVLTLTVGVALLGMDSAAALRTVRTARPLNLRSVFGLLMFAKLVFGFTR
jgi:hypothetical protein